MGFLFFGRKKEVDSTRIDESFGKVKQDIGQISTWIKHLHEKDKHHEENIEQVMEEIIKIREDIDDIKGQVFMFEHMNKRQVFKQQQTAVYKQTPVYGVQTAVQTGVQTPYFNEILKTLSPSERLIVWILLNSEVHLSCEDVAALLGKQSNTVRGQLNGIKQKSENLISEMLEKNGKKRYYIDEKIRDSLLKGLKIKSKDQRNRIKKSSFKLEE
jgi:hypothetical protein